MSWYLKSEPAKVEGGGWLKVVGGGGTVDNPKRVGRRGRVENQVWKRATERQPRETSGRQSRGPEHSEHQWTGGQGDQP